MQNSVLSALTSDDRALVFPRLEAVILDRRARLSAHHRALEFAYFIDDGLASVTHRLGPGKEAEVALMGNEGLSGAQTILDGEISHQGITVQIPGHARRIDVSILRSLAQNSSSLRRVLLRCLRLQSIQQDETSVAASMGQISHRVSRWLLLASDRVGDDINLPHEIIAASLGVRRAGVTITLNQLATRGHLVLARGNIHVVNRQGLIAESQGFYRAQACSAGQGC